MKTLLKISLATVVALGLSSSLNAADVEKDCSVKANGIKNVIATAKKYNDMAIAKGLEFRRLNVNNGDLITSIEEGIKSGAKEVNPINFKKKPSKTKLEINYAAERACKFSIRAIEQAQEAKTTWRLAVPGDGFKY